MAQVQSIFDQASAILNSKDANGDYIYGGGKTDVPPVNVDLAVASSRRCRPCPAPSPMARSRNRCRSADGQTVRSASLASDVGTGLMQALKDIADFDAGASGNFNRHQSDRGAEHFPDQRRSARPRRRRSDLNDGDRRQRLCLQPPDRRPDQQTSMTTLYKGFVSNIQDTNMADRDTQLTLNQTPLQAALQVTAELHQLSLLNYLPISAAAKPLASCGSPGAGPIGTGHDRPPPQARKPHRRRHVGRRGFLRHRRAAQAPGLRRGRRHACSFIPATRRRSARAPAAPGQDIYDAKRVAESARHSPLRAGLRKPLPQER